MIVLILYQNLVGNKKSFKNKKKQNIYPLKKYFFHRNFIAH